MQKRSRNNEVQDRREIRKDYFQAFTSRFLTTTYRSALHEIYRGSTTRRIAFTKRMASRQPISSSASTRLLLLSWSLWITFLHDSGMSSPRRRVQSSGV